MNEIKIDKLIRSNRRSVGLQIAADATLIVRAPYFVTTHELRQVIHDKRHWIISKQAVVREQLVSKKRTEYTQGSEILFLGEWHRLEFVNDHKKVFLEGNKLYIPAGEVPEIKEKLIGWYKSEALRHIEERVRDLSRLSGIEYKSIKISRARRRWGSCGPSGNLNFNWRLIMAPQFVIDYVIIHELAHIKIRNHSVHFWNEVSSLMPEYKKAEQWLKDHHRELDI